MGWPPFCLCNNLARQLPLAPECPSFAFSLSVNGYECSFTRYEQTIAVGPGPFHYEFIMSNQPLPYDVFMQKLHDHEVDALKASPILVIGDDGECTDRLVQTIRKRGLQAISCPDLSHAQSLLAQMTFSLVFCSEAVLQTELRSVIQVARATPVILLSRRTEGEACLDANHRGAFDCISCPPDSKETDSVMTLALMRSASVLVEQEES